MNANDQQFGELIARLNTPGFDPLELAREFVKVADKTRAELQRKLAAFRELFGRPMADPLDSVLELFDESFSNACPLFEQAIDEATDNIRTLSLGIQTAAANQSVERSNVEARVDKLCAVLGEACNTVDEYWRTRAAPFLGPTPGWFLDAMLLRDMQDRRL